MRHETCAIFREVLGSYQFAGRLHVHLDLRGQHVALNIALARAHYSLLQYA